MVPRSENEDKGQRSGLPTASDAGRGPKSQNGFGRVPILACFLNFR